MSNEVRLTLDSFMSLCKLAMQLHEEKERLRKIVVMQNRTLDALTSAGTLERNWIKGHQEHLKKLSDADLDMRDKHQKAFWPPRGMIP